MVGIGDLVYYKEDQSIGIIVSVIVLNSEDYERVPRLVTVYWMDGRTTDEFESDLEKIIKKT